MQDNGLSFHLTLTDLQNTTILMHAVHADKEIVNWFAIWW